MLNARGRDDPRRPWYTDLYGQRYLRCAPGRTNPLYPPGPEPERGESCAPTIDDLNYESVSIDLAQLDRQGDDGIWVVNRWELTEPFAQADPAVVEAQATERLEEFLAARIAGQGAEGLVEVDRRHRRSAPLCHHLGCPVRAIRDRACGRRGGHRVGTFRVRLFADGDASVIEQEFFWVEWRVEDG